MRSAIEIRRRQADRRLCYSLLVLDASDLKFSEMSGRQRMPAGEPRKASQRRARRGDAFTSLRKPCLAPRKKSMLVGRIGVFQRDLVDGEHAEIRISDRTYRVRLPDLA